MINLEDELKEIQGIEKELENSNPELATQLKEACALLADPSIHLKTVPQDTIQAEVTFLTCRYVSTTHKNREMADKWLQTILSENRDNIKKKLRNATPKNIEAMIYLTASTTVIRKILCGVLKEQVSINAKEKNSTK